MDDLISRQAAYEVLTVYYHHATDVQHAALHDALSKVPSAERHGRWVDLHCTVCGKVGWSDEDDYCPNCGSRMDLKGDIE